MYSAPCPDPVPTFSDGHRVAKNILSPKELEIGMLKIKNLVFSLLSSFFALTRRAGTLAHLSHASPSSHFAMLRWSANPVPFGNDVGRAFTSLCGNLD
jgi:hypothetical protein